MGTGERRASPSTCRGRSAGALSSTSLTGRISTSRRATCWPRARSRAKARVSSLPLSVKENQVQLVVVESGGRGQTKSAPVVGQIADSEEGGLLRLAVGDQLDFGIVVLAPLSQTGQSDGDLAEVALLDGVEMVQRSGIQAAGGLHEEDLRAAATDVHLDGCRLSQPSGGRDGSRRQSERERDHVGRAAGDGAQDRPPSPRGRPRPLAGFRHRRRRTPSLLRPRRPAWRGESRPQASAWPGFDALSRMLQDPEDAVHQLGRTPTSGPRVEDQEGCAHSATSESRGELEKAGVRVGRRWLTEVLIGAGVAIRPCLVRCRKPCWMR